MRKKKKCEGVQAEGMKKHTKMKKRKDKKQENMLGRSIEPHRKRQASRQAAGVGWTCKQVEAARELNIHENDKQADEQQEDY